MAKEEVKGDVGKPTFEQAIKELTGIVGKIEQGDITLGDSLQQYEKGMALIKAMQEDSPRCGKTHREDCRIEQNGGKTAMIWRAWRNWHTRKA